MLVMAAAGCASPAERPFEIAVQELSLPELVQACTKGAREEEPDLTGCFEWRGSLCQVYILPRWVREQRDGGLEGYHRTLGHELDHCRRGYFHGERPGVYMPPGPSLGILISR